MKNMKSSDSRRKLLKSIAAGSGAIVAGKSLPENWTRPAVDSVMLPAHAQTSGLNCGSLTADQEAGVPGGDIAIIFDENTCSLIEFDFALDGLAANAVMSFDTDMDDNLLWDDEGTGANWTRTGDNFVTGGENASGTDFFVRVSRGGSTYIVSFDVNVSGTVGGTGTMTVSNVTIVPE
jgi:hypothetical protein